MAHGGQSSGVHLEPPSFLPHLGSQQTPPNPSSDLWDFFQPQPLTEEQVEEAVTKEGKWLRLPRPPTTWGRGWEQGWGEEGRGSHSPTPRASQRHEGSGAGRRYQ